MWFIIGIVVGAFVGWLLTWIRNKAFKVTWYEYLLGTIGLGLLLLAMQLTIGSILEIEFTAPWLMLLFVGLPSLIFLGVTYQLVRRHNRAS